MRYVAFLRGMNVGGRRITNDDLCTCFRDLGLGEPWAFLASGNVAFESTSTSRARVAKLVEKGLGEALGYDVPTFLRTAKDVIAAAAHAPFPKAEGKVQVAMLAKGPTAAQRKKVLALSTSDDRLAIEGQELYWLPAGNLLDSELDLPAIERTLGPMTVRTHRTLQRLARKLSDG